LSKREIPAQKGVVTNVRTGTPTVKRVITGGSPPYWFIGGFELKEEKL